MGTTPIERPRSVPWIQAWLAMLLQAGIAIEAARARRRARPMNSRALRRAHGDYRTARQRAADEAAKAREAASS